MLSGSISAEIESEVYQCLICTSEIGPSTKIWSCSGCWRVYDLKCIQDWSSRKKDEPWRCPHCSKLFTVRRLKYRCWCGKQTNPESLPHMPHSCGQSCGARLKCPHPCSQICHPGPHRDCSAMGPKVSCFCGRHKVQTTCQNTKYNGFSCGEVCNKKYKCNLHNCRRKCHRGGCGPCPVKIRSQCYCGKEKKSIACSKIPKDSNGSGGYACKNICGHILDCGNHYCEQKCHPETPHACKLVPKKDEKCNCGKTPVSVLLGRPRETCLEPIPCCDQICGQRLSCGHQCQEKCHEHDCPPCSATVSVSCSCGSTVFKIKCGDPVPQCQKKCNAMLLCTRHKCEKLCCPFSNSQSSKKGRKRVTLEDIMSDMSLSEEEMAAHMCTKTCDRLLGCGKHRCRQLCHPGGCPPCLRSSSEDYICSCGKTHVLAPIRCGTKIPDCTAQCHRPRACGHKSLHRCHDDSKQCPPCTQTVFRPCVCGKNKVPVPCTSTTARHCVHECGKVLDCGHQCRLVCHEGDCPPCSSLCLKTFPCGHQHTEKCHLDSPCGECTEALTAFCRCGHLACRYECGEDVEVFCNETCFNTEPPYADILLHMYEAHPAWCRIIEDEVRQFVISEDRRHWFKPMKKPKRRFVHYLIEHYGLQGTSMDYGPNRAVMATKTPACWLPQTRLARAIRLARLHGVPISADVGDSDEFDSN